MTEKNRPTFQGIVLKGKSGPAMKMVMDSKTKKEVPVMWFTLKYNDRRWRNEETGKMDYNEKYIKCFLPRNSFGESIFRNLAGGRVITASGNIKPDVYTLTREDGSQDHLPSLIMSDTTVEFLDLPLERQVQNMLEIINENGLINEDGTFNCNANEFSDCICEYAGQLKGKVIENNNTSKKTGTTGRPSF